MELLSGPLFSVILVVLAGVALRYALWMGRDGEAKRAGDTINEFEQRTRSLHAALENEQATQQKLRTDLEQAAHDLESIKQTSEQRLIDLKAQQKLTRELERQLADQQAMVSQRDVSSQQAVVELRAQLEAMHREVAEKEDQIRDLMSDRHAQEENQTAVTRELEQKITELYAQLQQTVGERDAQSTLAARYQDELRQSDLRWSAELETLQSRLTAEACTSTSRERDLQAMTARVEALEDQTTALQAENEQLRRSATELQAAHLSIEAADQARVEMQATIDSLQRQLAESLDENEHLVDRAGQAARLAGQLHEESKHSASLQELVTELRDDIQLHEQTLARLRAEKQADSQRIECMEKELQFAQDHAREIVGELESIKAEHEQLQTASDELQEASTAAGTQIAALHDRNRDLEIERDELLRGMRRALDEKADAESDLQAAQEAIQRLEADLSQIAGIQRQIAQVTGELETEVARVDALTRERDTLQAAQTALENELRELRSLNVVHTSEREQHTAQLTQIQCRLVDTKSELESESQRRVVIEQELQGLTQQLAASELQLEQMQQEMLAKQHDLETALGEKSELQKLLSAEQHIRKDVEEKLQIHAETIEQLRVDSSSLESLLAQQVALQSSLEQHTHRLAASKPTDRGRDGREILSFKDARRGSQAADDPVLGALYRQRPQRVDDLKCISGIGQVLEDKLNMLGVYTYEQIMKWTPEAINRFSELLSFKDRIERDQWVAQATRLHEESNFRAA